MSKNNFNAMSRENIKMQIKKKEASGEEGEGVRESINVRSPSWAHQASHNLNVNVRK